MFTQFPKKTLFSKLISGIVAVSFILTSVPIRSYAALGTADKLSAPVADKKHASKVEEIQEELKLLTQERPETTFVRESARPIITPITQPGIFVLSNKISLLRGAMTGGYNIGHAIGENADGGVFNHSEWRAMLEGTLSAVLESLTSVDKHEVAKGTVTLSASAKKDYIERVKRLTNLPEKDIEEFLPEIQKHLLYAQTAKNLQRQIETLARRIVNKAVNNLLKEVIARSNGYPFKQTVVCVGETKNQFDDKRTEEILKQDLEEILAGITQQEAEKIGLRIAYEARWVIGKGVIPLEVFAKVNEIHGFIKQQVGKEALKLTLFVDYGASVNKGNIDKIAVLPNVDGFLIGGAAKLPEEVGQMIDILNFLGLDKRFNFGMNWKAEGEETGLKPVNEFVEILKAKDLSKVQIAISTPNVAPVKNAVAGLIPVKLALLNKFSVYLSVVSSTEEVGLGYSKGIIASSEKAAMNLPFEQLEKLFGEKTKKGDTYFLIGKNNAYFALAKENSVDQTLTVSPTVDLSNPAVLETYYSSLLEYTYLVTTKSQKGLELISIAGNELKLKSFLTKEGAEAEARANSSNIVEEDFVSGNLIGKKRWMGTGLLRDKFFQFEYNIGSPKKGVRPTLLTFKKSKSKLARGWSAIIQPKFTHLIFGFGTIGSEVGKKSREMGFNVVAVNRSPNEKAGLAQSLGIPLYLLSPDDKKAFEKAKIGAEGILEDLLKDGEVDLITDATDGETEDPETGKEITVAAYNTKYIYSKYPNIKVMYEGAEDPKIAGRFFDSGTLNVLKIPYSQIMKDVNSLFFPSCNTTGQGFILDRVASNSKDLVVKVTTGRRANDPGQKGKLSPDGTKIETGYHHADDYLEGREAYPEILNAFRKGAKNKPSLTTDASNTHLTKFHITEMWVSGFDKKTDKRLTAETVKKLLSQEPRISLVDFKKDAFDATLLIDILFNKLGIVHPFTPIVQVLDLADSGDVKITLAVPQESIVIPNNMNGIHALTGLYEREASTRLVNDVMQIAEISQAIESTLPLKSARVKTKESKEVEIPAIPGIVTYTNKQLEDFKSPDGKPVYATLNTDIGDIENGMVSDKQDKKLVEGFDYLERLSKNNALYILGHNGRPAGKYVEKLGLFGVTRWYAFRRAQIYGQGIEEHIGKKDTNGRFIEASYWVIKNYRGSGDVKVWFLPDTDEVSIKRYAQIIKDLKPGDWAIPENRRMDFREQAGDPAGENPTGDPALREAAIKDMLYRGGEELLVGPIGFNFGTADVHRYDARITAAGKFLLLASGENTADFMGRVNKIRSLIGQAHEKGAVALIVSGLKKDKIELLLEAINNVAQKGDKVVVVGAINAYPLAAEGKSTGKMEIKKDALEMWQEVVEAAKAKGVDLYYPKALKVVKDLTTAKKEDIKVIQDGNIPEDYVIGDVDEQGLAEIFKIGEDENVKLVLQAGPVGPFDLNDVLAEGSNKFQQKLVELSLKKKVVSLGSDTQKANKKAGVEGKFPNQFTDGGSFLDALTCPAGEDCPAITALKESAKIYAGVIAKDIEKEAEKVETAADAVMTEN